MSDEEERELMEALDELERTGKSEAYPQAVERWKAKRNARLRAEHRRRYTGDSPWKS